MKEFRNELLELLLASVGDFIDITDLLNKYCGIDNDFESDDETKIQRRLKINLHFRELKEMGWIITTGELSTAHHMNHQSGKREFSLDQKVKARMTTKGELEYNGFKKQEKTDTSQVTIGHQFSGVFINASDLYETDFRPILNSTTTYNSELSGTRPKTSLWKFILNNIIWVIITTVIGGLIVGYLLYKLGWI
jgi:hypothetical protein